MKIAFLDTETTGLDPERHAVWEIAVILREEGGTAATDTEYLWQIRPLQYELDKADPKALEVNRFHERIAVPAEYQAADMSHVCGLPHYIRGHQVVDTLRELLAGVVLAGSNPDFDTGFLRAILGGAPWHYRTLDVPTLAAGYLHGCIADRARQVTPPAIPYSSRDLSRAVGVEPPGDGVAHTALGDSRWMRDVYDAITGDAS